MCGANCLDWNMKCKLGHNKVTAWGGSACFFLKDLYKAPFHHLVFSSMYIYIYIN